MEPAARAAGVALRGKVAAVRERLSRANRGELVVFESRFGKGVMTKAYSSDEEKLRAWAERMGVPLDVVRPASGVPHLVVVTGEGRRRRSARRRCRKDRGRPRGRGGA